MRSLKWILDAGLVLYGVAAASAHWHFDRPGWIGAGGIFKPLAPATSPAADPAATRHLPDAPSARDVIQSFTDRAAATAQLPAAAGQAVQPTEQAP